MKVNELKNNLKQDIIFKFIWRVVLTFIKYIQTISIDA